ncbi:MAG: sugar kinase, partial [Candidatus Bipolaricaulota bacterium]
MKQEHALGVDIGATWVRVALADTQGNILAREKEKIQTSDELGVSRQISRLGSQLCKQTGRSRKELVGIG